MVTPPDSGGFLVPQAGEKLGVIYWRGNFQSSSKNPACTVSGSPPFGGGRTIGRFWLPLRPRQNGEAGEDGQGEKNSSHAFFDSARKSGRAGESLRGPPSRSREKMLGQPATHCPGPCESGSVAPALVAVPIFSRLPEDRARAGARRVFFRYSNCLVLTVLARERFP